jgi:hypothetical protein
VPKHVCPTVNNFSQALIVRDGEIAGVETVSARGREGPIWRPESSESLVEEPHSSQNKA